MNSAGAESPPVRYEEIAEYLRGLIASEALSPGARLPSFTELQSQFTTTPGTVNRALIQLEQNGLIVRERRRGVFVAQRCKRPRTNIIGVSGAGFVFTAYSAYWSHLFGGIRQAADRAGWRVLLLDHDSFDGWEKADGIIFYDRSFGKQNCPIPPEIPGVSLVVPAPDTSCVTSDDFAGARAATEYLISLGHRKIAYLGNRHRSASEWRLQRRKGYAQALRDAGIEARPEWIRQLRDTGNPVYYGADFIREARETMLEWLQDSWMRSGCTAILAHNDESAIGVMEALRQAGLDVPRDVSVVGYDGTEVCDYCQPRMTSMAVPLRQIGERSVELLLKQIAEDRRSVEKVTFPVTLQVRESAAPPPGSTPAHAII